MKEEEFYKLPIGEDFSLHPDLFKETFRQKLDRFIAWLGFYHVYQCKVTSEPEACADGFTYTLKAVGKTNYWFYIPVRRKVFKENEQINFPN